MMYVAGAYTGKSTEEVHLNIEAARKVAQIAVRRGWFPIIPHANTAGFEVLCPDVTYEFWIEGTKELLRRCDAMTMVPGWEDSKGAKGEVDEALLCHIPIYYETRHIPQIGEGP
jgi:hypothetical protein